MKTTWFVASALVIGTLLVSGCNTPQEADRPLAPAIHPEIWPALESPVGLDPVIEDRITDLLGRMSVEDKVGQVIQGEIRHLTPDDVRIVRAEHRDALALVPRPLAGVGF